MNIGPFLAMHMIRQQQMNQQQQRLRCQREDEERCRKENDKSTEIDENLVSSEQEEQQMIDDINENCD